MGHVVPEIVGNVDPLLLRDTLQLLVTEWHFVKVAHVRPPTVLHYRHEAAEHGTGVAHTTPITTVLATVHAHVIDELLRALCSQFVWLEPAELRHDPLLHLAVVAACSRLLELDVPIVGLAP